MKIRPVKAELFMQKEGGTDGETDMTMLMVACSNFEYAPQCGPQRQCTSLHSVRTIIQTSTIDKSKTKLSPQKQSTGSNTELSLLLYRNTD